MKIPIVCLFLCISVAIQAQGVQKNPYVESLKFHLESLKKHNHLKDTVYLQPNDYLNLSSGLFEGTYIKVVDKKLVKEKTKCGKMIGLIVVNPVVFEGDIQSITVVHFTVTRKKSHYNFINSGGITVILSYDCEEEKYNYEIVGSH